MCLLSDDAHFEPLRDLHVGDAKVHLGTTPMRETEHAGESRRQGGICLRSGSQLKAVLG